MSLPSPKTAATPKLLPTGSIGVPHSNINLKSEFKSRLAEPTSGEILKNRGTSTNFKPTTPSRTENFSHGLGDGGQETGTPLGDSMHEQAAESAAAEMPDAVAGLANL